MNFRRPAIGSATLTLLVAAYVLFLCNHTFWSKVSEQFAGDPVHLGLLGAVLLILYGVVLLVFSAPYVIKPVFIAVVLVAAGVSYFTDTFGTVMDRDMIQSLPQMTGMDFGHLITRPFLRHMLLYGVVPSLLIAWVRPVHLPFGQRVKINTVIGFGLLALAGLIIVTNLGTYRPFWERNRDVAMAYLNPAAGLVSAVDDGLRQFRYATIVARPYGVDARIGSRVAGARKKMLTVLVVGDSARAQNFTLNGYERDTNPKLAARNVIAFTNVTSCGTSISVSVLCMFSHLDREDFTRREALGWENLVDVLKHAGLTVEWWDNNTGSQNVADRIPTIDLSEDETTDPDLCKAGKCFDQVLVDKLRARLNDLQDNAVLVLHTMGSRGPAYYQRYPEEFERFRPACHRAEVTECSMDELVNAYDNTILYTDHILASIIDVLKEHNDEFASAMYYMSDHGESLGENKLYLHDAPYFLAPDVQKRVPFIAWFSDDFAKTIGLDLSCVRSKIGDSFSHDNMFDTILGMMNVKTKVYDVLPDSFAPCRGSTPAGQGTDPIILQ
jgi:lipid A ethanolaminephosphotransferase